MSVSAFTSSAPALLVATAVGYALATIGMKSLSYGPSLVGLALLGIGLCAAIAAEIALLRQTDLSLVYLAIVATETLLVLGYAVSIGESLGLRHLFGGLLVISGLIFIST